MGGWGSGEGLEAAPVGHCQKHLSRAGAQGKPKSDPHTRGTGSRVLVSWPGVRPGMEKGSDAARPQQAHAHGPVAEAPRHSHRCRIPAASEQHLSGNSLQVSGQHKAQAPHLSPRHQWAGTHHSDHRDEDAQVPRAAGGLEENRTESLMSPRFFH